MEKEVFVARQPILDRRGVVIAQELLFRDALSGVANVQDGFACSAAVVERVLGEFGLEQVLGGAEAYLNCTDEFLFSGLVDVLPVSRFVLEVLEETALTPELGMRCDALRQAGFRIALDDVRSLTPDIERFLPHVDIVKLDWPFIGADEVSAIVACCQRAGKIVLAEKVEERVDHAAAMQLGCDLFQGFYFARPQTLVGKKTPAMFGPVLHVLQLLMEDASDFQLETALKGAPALVVQLLRLANSGAHPHMRQTSVTSVRQALGVVGSRQLMRWCCLLLYGDPIGLSSTSDPLVQLVDRRASFMERAVREVAPGNSDLRQAAWLAGLLSLAHVPHGVDVRVFITELPVDATIQQAIIKHQGKLGTLLAIAEHLEDGHFESAFQMACTLDQSLATKLSRLAL